MCYFVQLSLFFFGSFLLFVISFLSLSFSSCNLFSRHEISQNHLVNAPMLQSKQIFYSFLSKLPLSSSSHTWNLIHFNNQMSTTHATHSQFNYEPFNNSNDANVSTSSSSSSIHNHQHDEQSTVRFGNELRQRHFNRIAQLMCNQNYSHGFQYYGLTNSCAHAACKHHRASLAIDHVSKLIAHFMGNYHVISYAIIGIAFYVTLFYIIYCIKWATHHTIKTNGNQFSWSTHWLNRPCTVDTLSRRMCDVPNWENWLNDLEFYRLHHQIYNSPVKKERKKSE